MRKILFGTFCVAVAVLFFSCGSVPKAEQPPAESHTEAVYEADPSEAVSIAVPGRKNRSFFNGIDSDVVSDVEIGSPDRLRSAFTMLKKDSDSYAENEKVLLNVAAAIMQIVWRSEKFTADIPAADSSTPYMGAIESARNGVYDEITGNNDFLTKVLPSLVLITSETRSDYYERSEADLKSAIEENGDSALATYLLGTLYKRMKRYDDAVAAFEKSAGIASDCFEPLFALAQMKMLSGNAKSALSDAETLLHQYDGNRDLLKLAAEAAFAAGNYDDAEQYVARVLQQESDNSYYILFRAKILVHKGDYIKAASLLDVYARTDAVSRDYLLLRAKVQKDWNRNNMAALATIEQALRFYPDDTEIILTAAEISSQTGMKVGGKGARELAEQILQIDPKNVSALQIQIEEMRQAKNYSGAYKASSTLMSLPNVPADAVYTHIAICLAARRTDEAWQRASELYNDTPHDEQVLQSYIQVLVSTGRRQEAERMIAQQMSSANARMKSFLYYQHSYLVSSEDAVLTDLRSSLTSNPRNKDALMRLYEIYYAKKEYRKAQYYLKQVVALSPGDESLLELNRDLERLLSR